MPKVVVVGPGIVGTSLAHELTARGFTDVVHAEPVVDPEMARIKR